MKPGFFKHLFHYIINAGPLMCTFQDLLDDTHKILYKTYDSTKMGVKNYFIFNFKLYCFNLSPTVVVINTKTNTQTKSLLFLAIFTQI